MENVLGRLQRVAGTSISEKAQEVEAQDAESLRAELREVGRLMARNDLWFQLECDDNLIDACIYQRSALEARYRHLLALARRQELCCAPFAKK